MMQKSPPLRTAGAFLPKRLNRKPGSVLNDDLSRLHVAMQLQPPPGTRRARIVPIWALLLVGFTEPRKSPSALVRSYRTFPPFPILLRVVYFCCTFPQIALGGRYPLSLPCGARTFLMRGLSALRPRLSDPVAEVLYFICRKKSNGLQFLSRADIIQAGNFKRGFWI